MNRELIERFCTPPSRPIIETDAKALADAERLDIPFDGTALAGYSWGTGPNVLLVHGWGSRASHLSFLAHFLARSGYRVVAYDAPAHSSAGTPSKPESNMFEYCGAIAAAAAATGPLLGIVGHSFGATCAAFTLAGTSLIAEQQIAAQKLALVSPAPTLSDVYKSFTRKDQIGPEGLAHLKQELEAHFHFNSEEYTLHDALRNTGADTLIVHDTDDEEFSVPDIQALQKSAPSVRLLLTSGSGHQKILANRTMMAGVRDHLSFNPTIGAV